MKVRNLTTLVVIIAAAALSVAGASAQVVTSGQATAGAAGTAQPAGEWILDTERSQDPADVLGAARGASGMVMRGGGGGGGMVRRSDGSGGGGGNVVMRRDGGGAPIMAIFRDGERLGLEIAEDRIAVRAAGAAALELTPGGDPVRVRRWGQDVRANVRIADGTFVIETTTADGASIIERFRVNAEGELLVEVEVPVPAPGAEARRVTVQRVYTRS